MSKISVRLLVINWAVINLYSSTLSALHVCMSNMLSEKHEQKDRKAKRWIDRQAKRQRRATCTHKGESETARKVTEGGSHQNANVVWDIYCGVLMQFKTGSLSCSLSPSPCWALINQPLKADVT